MLPESSNRNGDQMGILPFSIFSSHNPISDHWSEMWPTQPFRIILDSCWLFGCEHMWLCSFLVPWQTCSHISSYSRAKISILRRNLVVISCTINLQVTGSKNRTVQWPPADPSGSVNWSEIPKSSKDWKDLHLLYQHSASCGLGLNF